MAGSFDVTDEEVNDFLALCFSNIEEVVGNSAAREMGATREQRAVSSSGEIKDMTSQARATSETDFRHRKTAAGLWREAAVRDSQNECLSSGDHLDRDRNPYQPRNDNDGYPCCQEYIALNVDWPNWFPNGKVPEDSSRKVLPQVRDAKEREFCDVYLASSLQHWKRAVELSNEIIRLEPPQNTAVERQCFSYLIEDFKKLYLRLDSGLLNAVRSGAGEPSVQNVNAAAFDELPLLAPCDVWEEFVLKDLRSFHFFLRGILLVFSRRWSEFKSETHEDNTNVILRWVFDTAPTKPQAEPKLTQRKRCPLQIPAWRCVIPSLSKSISDVEAVKNACENWMNASLQFRNCYEHGLKITEQLDLLSYLTSVLHVACGKSTVNMNSSTPPERFRESGLETLIRLAPAVGFSDKLKDFCVSDMISIVYHLLRDMEKTDLGNWPTGLLEVAKRLPEFCSLIEMVLKEDCFDLDVLNSALATLQNIANSQQSSASELVPKHNLPRFGRNYTVVEDWPDYFPDGKLILNWRTLAKISKVPIPSNDKDGDFGSRYLSKSYEFYRVFNCFSGEIVRLDPHFSSHVVCLGIFLAKLHAHADEVRVAMELVTELTYDEEEGALIRSVKGELPNLILQLPRFFRWNEFCRQDLRNLVDLSDRALAAVGDALRGKEFFDQPTAMMVQDFVKVCVRQGSRRLEVKKRPEGTFVNPPWLSIDDEFRWKMLENRKTPELAQFLDEWIKLSDEFRPRYRVLQVDDLESISKLYDRLVEAVAAVALAELGYQGFLPRRGPNFILPREYQLQLPLEVKQFCAEDSNMVVQDITEFMGLIIKQAKAAKSLKRKGSFAEQSLGMKLGILRFHPDVRNLLAKYSEEADRIPVRVAQDVILLERVMRVIVETSSTQRRISKRMISDRPYEPASGSSSAPRQNRDTGKEKKKKTVAPLQLTLDDEQEMDGASISKRPVGKVAPMPKREPVSPAIEPDPSFEYHRYEFRIADFCDEHGNVDARRLEVYAEHVVKAECTKLKFSDKQPLQTALYGWFEEQAAFMKNYRSMANAAVKLIFNPLRDEMEVKCLDLVLNSFFRLILAVNALIKNLNEPGSAPAREGIAAAKEYKPARGLVRATTNMRSKAIPVVRRRLPAVRDEMIWCCLDFCRKAKTFQVQSSFLSDALAQLSSFRTSAKVQTKTEFETPSPFQPAWLLVEELFLTDLRDTCEDLAEHRLTKENIEIFLAQWATVSKSMRKKAQKLAKGREPLSTKFGNLYEFLQTNLLPAMLQLRKRGRGWTPPEKIVSDADFFRRRQQHKSFASLIPLIPHPRVYEFCAQDVGQLLEAVCFALKLSFTEEVAQECNATYRSAVRSGLDLYKDYDPIGSLFDRMIAIEELLAICPNTEEAEPEATTSQTEFEEALRIKRERSRSVSPAHSPGAQHGPTTPDRGIQNDVPMEAGSLDQEAPSETEDIDITTPARSRFASGASERSQNSQSSRSPSDAFPVESAGNEDSSPGNMPNFADVSCDSDTNSNLTEASTSQSVPAVAVESSAPAPSWQSILESSTAEYSNLTAKRSRPSGHETTLAQLSSSTVQNIEPGRFNSNTEREQRSLTPDNVGLTSVSIPQPLVTVPIVDSLAAERTPSVALEETAMEVMERDDEQTSSTSFHQSEAFSECPEFEDPLAAVFSEDSATNSPARSEATLVSQDSVSLFKLPSRTGVSANNTPVRSQADAVGRHDGADLLKRRRDESVEREAGEPISKRVELAPTPSEVLPQPNRVSHAVSNAFGVTSGISPLQRYKEMLATYGDASSSTSEQVNHAEVAQLALSALNKLKYGQSLADVSESAAEISKRMTASGSGASETSSNDPPESVQAELAAISVDSAQTRSPVSEVVNSPAELTSACIEPAPASPISQPESPSVSPAPAITVPLRTGRAPKRPAAPQRRPIPPIVSHDDQSRRTPEVAGGSRESSPFGNTPPASPSSFDFAPSSPADAAASPASPDTQQVSPTPQSGGPRQKVVVKRLTGRSAASRAAPSPMQTNALGMPRMVAGVQIANHPDAAPFSSPLATDPRRFAPTNPQPASSPAPQPAAQASWSHATQIQRAKEEAKQRWISRVQAGHSRGRGSNVPAPFRGPLLMHHQQVSRPGSRGVTPPMQTPRQGSGPIQKGEHVVADPRLRAALARKAQDEQQQAQLQAQMAAKRRLETELQQRDREKIEQELGEIEQHSSFVRQKMATASASNEQYRLMLELIGCVLISDATSCCEQFSVRSAAACRDIAESERLNGKIKELTRTRNLCKQQLQDLSSNKGKRDAIALRLSHEAKGLSDDLALVRELALTQKCLEPPVMSCLRVAKLLREDCIPELRRQLGQGTTRTDAFDPERAKRCVALLAIQHLLERLAGRSETYDPSCKKILDLLSELIQTVSNRSGSDSVLL